jgi:hypothetical protein
MESCKINMKFDVFTQDPFPAVCWVTPCSLVGGHQRYRSPCSLVDSTIIIGHRVVWYMGTNVIGHCVVWYMGTNVTGHRSVW